MAKKVRTMGMMARFKVAARRPFHILEADRISEALKRIIKHMTVITLISETPNVANIPNTDVVLIVLLTVLSIDDNMIFSNTPDIYLNFLFGELGINSLPADKKIGGKA